MEQNAKLLFVSRFVETVNEEQEWSSMALPIADIKSSEAYMYATVCMLLKLVASQVTVIKSNIVLLDMLLLFPLFCSGNNLIPQNKKLACYPSTLGSMLPII